MPAFTLATASNGRSGTVHLVPAGAAQSWCGRRADHPVRGPIRLGAVCRRCWAAAPEAGKQVIQVAACPPERVG